MSSLNALKRQIVQMAYNAREGHIPSALSILDIVWVLYNKVMTLDDRFVLSKGHGCLALYVVLAEKGFITPEQLATFAKHDSILGGHPDRNKVPGVLCSTGSLGHGLPQAVGIALAKKIKGEPGRVFCLVGDGECNEGSIWEACLLAKQHKLNNLVVIVDYNRSTDRAVDISSICEKFWAFGFFPPTINGHNHDEIIKVLGYDPSSRPTAIIANTVKGFGCKRMEDPAWHHRAPNETELAEIMKELE